MSSQPPRTAVCWDEAEYSVNIMHVPNVGLIVTRPASRTRRSWSDARDCSHWRNKEGNGKHGGTCNDKKQEGRLKIGEAVLVSSTWFLSKKTSLPEIITILILCSNEDSCQKVSVNEVNSTLLLITSLFIDAGNKMSQIPCLGIKLRP